MLISTRGRYALRVMIDLAETGQEGYVPMGTIARRQGISLKYMERILPILTKNGLIQGVHGKGGGYRLCHPPEAYRVGDILRLTEGDLAPVTCTAQGIHPCGRACDCRTLPMWRRFHALINDFFDGITLADLMQTGGAEDAMS